MNSTCFILLIKLARAAGANVEIFGCEAVARERWRAAAIAAVTGMPFGQHAVTWAQLFSAPPVGSKHEARKARSRRSLQGARKLAFRGDEGRR
jgi:hypothetical protein